MLIANPVAIFLSDNPTFVTILPFSIITAYALVVLCRAVFLIREKVPLFGFTFLCNDVKIVQVIHSKVISPISGVRSCSEDGFSVVDICLLNREFLLLSLRLSSIRGIANRSYSMRASIRIS